LLATAGLIISIRTLSSAAQYIFSAIMGIAAVLCAVTQNGSVVLLLAILTVASKAFWCLL